MCTQLWEFRSEPFPPELEYCPRMLLEALQCWAGANGLPLQLGPALTLSPSPPPPHTRLRSCLQVKQIRRQDLRKG